jgi:hypothetical protein
VTVHEIVPRDIYENGKKENARAPAQKPEDITKEKKAKIGEKIFT